MSGLWKHGFCGCFDNFGMCIIAYFIPCYTFGKNAEAIGENCMLYGILMLVPLVNIIMAIGLRGKIRASHGIAGGVFGDVMSWICCPFCALMQEAQEVAGVTPQGMAIDRV